MLLVTGITGHSGRYFLQELIKNKYEEPIRCIVRKTSDTVMLDSCGLKIEKLVGNLEDQEFVNKAMMNIDTAMHIYNIHHSPMIVQAAIKNNVKRAILVHTTGIYSNFKNASQEYQDVEKIVFELTKDERYKKRAQQLLEWLNKNAYSNIQSPVIKRGKGDSTVATDTYAWSISSVGPEVLKESGMDPDGIIDFAVENCAVQVTYQKFDGSTVNVKGFDFAKHQNLARGGVVSCEWSAQMILALKIMADYYRHSGNTEKADHYAGLAGEYISELSKMIITSPSPVGQGDFCLPYASQEFADTGHGWRTPKGNRTGSVAATAYAILAIDGFNPLRFNKP